MTWAIDTPLGDWAKQALCATSLADFFPDAWDTEGAAVAIEVCSRCPVRDACLEHALRAYRNSGDAGIWGGTTIRERERLRRLRRQP